MLIKPNIAALELAGNGSRQRGTGTMAYLWAAILLAQYVALGANLQLFSIIAGTAAQLAAIACLLVLRPSRSYWYTAWPPLALIGLALLFATIVVPTASIYTKKGQILTGDLHASAAVILLGNASVLLAGSWIGFKRGGARRIAAGVVTAGMIDLAVGVLMNSIDNRLVWGMPKGIHIDRFTGTFLNGNAAACVFAATALLSLGFLQDSLLYRARSGLRIYFPLLALFGVLIATIACLLTKSRAASLLLCAIMLAAILLDAGMRRRFALLPRWLKGSSFALIVGLTCLLMGTTTAERLSSWHTDLAERFELWRHFLVLALRSPLAGYGPGSIPHLIASSMESPADAHLLWYVNSSHNILLGIVLEHGFIFLIMIAAAGLLLARGSAESRKRLIERPINRALMGACLLIFLCSMIDIALDVPAISATFFLLLGAAWGQLLRANAGGGSILRDERRRLIT